MHKVIILPSAEQDIRDATFGYNFRQKELGKRFIAQVRSTVKFIRKNPLTATNRYDAVRTAFQIPDLLWLITR